MELPVTELEADVVPGCSSGGDGSGGGMRNRILGSLTGFLCRVWWGTVRDQAKSRHRTRAVLETYTNVGGGGR